MRYIYQQRCAITNNKGTTATGQWWGWNCQEENDNFADELVHSQAMKAFLFQNLDSQVERGRHVHGLSYLGSQ